MHADGRRQQTAKRRRGLRLRLVSVRLSGCCCGSGGRWSLADGCVGAGVFDLAARCADHRRRLGDPAVGLGRVGQGGWPSSSGLGGARRDKGHRYFSGGVGSRRSSDDSSQIVVSRLPACLPAQLTKDPPGTSLRNISSKGEEGVETSQAKPSKQTFPSQAEPSRAKPSETDPPRSPTATRASSSAFGCNETAFSIVDHRAADGCSGCTSARDFRSVRRGDSISSELRSWRAGGEAPSPRPSLLHQRSKTGGARARPALCSRLCSMAR